MTSRPQPRQTKRISELRRALLDHSVDCLWTFKSADYEIDGADFYAELFLDTLEAQLEPLRLLLTENTRIRRGPFNRFCEDIQGLLPQDTTASYDPDGATKLQSVFTEYRRNERNFAPLRTHVRVLQNGDPSFYACIAEEDEFFAVAAGNDLPTLVHFDQWIKFGARKIITREYATRLSACARPDSTVVVVDKKFGPIGPKLIWEDVVSTLPCNPAVVEFDQHTRGISPLRGHEPFGQHFIVLYDLIKSGGGLLEVQRELQRKYGTEAVVEHIILFDYNCGLDDTDEDTLAVVRELEPVHRIFAPPKFKYTALEDLLSTAKVLATHDAQLFETRKLADVDPMSRRGVDLAVDSSWLARQVHLQHEYAGKWIGVYDRSIVAEGESLSDVLAALPSKHKLALVQYIPADDDLYGTTRA